MQQDTQPRHSLTLKTQNSTNSQKTPASWSGHAKKGLASSSSQSPMKSGRTAASSQRGMTINDNFSQMMKQLKDQEQELNQLRSLQRSEENSTNIIADLSSEVTNLKAQLGESEQARQEMQDKIVASTSIEKNTKVKFDKFNDLVMKENEDLKQKLSKKDADLREKDSRVEYLRQLINQYELEKHDMKLSIEETVTKYSVHKGSLFESEQKRVALQKEYERCLDEYNKKLSLHYQAIEQLTKENEDLKQTLRDLEAKNGKLQQDKVQLEILWKEEQDKTKKMNETLKIITDLQSERDLLLKALEQQNKERDQMLNRFAQLREETDQILGKVKSDLEELSDAKKQLEKELFEKDEELAKKDVTIKHLTNKQLEMGENIQKAKNFMDVHNDLQKQLERARQENEGLSEMKRKAQDDLLQSNNLLEHASLGSGESAQQIKDLLQRIEEQDQEIDAMKRYVQLMRAKFSIYIPDKDDQIDTQLAEYINNYPERSKLRIMFLKESNGVYQFGSRKVYVRVERDRISVRVGGGYLSIDEFLDIYTPMELDRVDRNDPVKKFSEKVAVQKALAFNSPTRSPRDSCKTTDDQSNPLQRMKSQSVISPRGNTQNSPTKKKTSKFQ